MTQTISVTLPNDVIYCSGTVNGTEYTWTNIADNTWETTVERVENGIYEVRLTLITASNATFGKNFTLYYGLQNLITDRTENDVGRWKTLHNKGWQNLTEEEKEEWSTSLKGSYNYTDMNRVESAVVYVANRLTELGYPVSVNAKTTWAVTDKPTKVDMDRYYGNVAKLRSIIAVYATTPLSPTTAKKLNYATANDLERILVDIDNLLSKLSQSWYYSGEIYAGEV